MTNQAQNEDLKLLLMEVLADSRAMALLQHFRRLSSRNRRLLLRIARGLGRGA